MVSQMLVQTVFVIDIATRQRPLAALSVVEPEASIEICNISRLSLHPPRYDHLGLRVELRRNLAVGV